MKENKRSTIYIVIAVVLLSVGVVSQLHSSVMNTEKPADFYSYDNRSDMDKSIKFTINSSMAEISAKDLLGLNLQAWRGVDIIWSTADFASVNLLNFANLFEGSTIERLDDTATVTIKGNVFVFKDKSGTALVNGVEYPLIMFHYSENPSHDKRPEGQIEAWNWMKENLDYVSFSYFNARMRKDSPLIHGLNDAYLFDIESMTVPVSFLNEFFIIATDWTPVNRSELTMDISDITSGNYILDDNNLYDLSAAPHTFKYKSLFNALPQWIRDESAKNAEKIASSDLPFGLPFGVAFDPNNTYLSDEQILKLQSLENIDGSGFYLRVFEADGQKSAGYRISFFNATKMGVDFSISLVDDEKYALNAYMPLKESGVLPDDFVDEIFAIMCRPFVKDKLDRQVLQFTSENGETYKFFFSGYGLSTPTLYVLQKGHPALAGEIIINCHIEPKHQTRAGSLWLDENIMRTTGFSEDFGLGVPLSNDLRQVAGLSSIAGWYNTEPELKAAYDSGAIVQKMNALGISVSHQGSRYYAQ